VNLVTLFTAVVAQLPPSSSVGPPTPFQVAGVVMFGALLVLSLTAMFLGRATRREGIGWSLVWFCAAVAIIKPELTDTVARALGIGRGADIVMYCSVVTMMVGFMVVYVRLRRLQRELTLVVRHLALREANSPAGTWKAGLEGMDRESQENFWRT